jgi:L-gulonate 3-dehydrogenase
VLGVAITAVIGCGTIGVSWARRFAASRHVVRLFDARPGVADAAMTMVEGSWGKDGAIDTPRVTVAASLEAALADVDYVQESITEDIAAKRAIFAALDMLAPPHAVLASSTSAISGADFLDVQHAERCLVAHPANPPHLIPLVEIVPTRWTSARVTQASIAFLRATGMIPVVLRREVEGFVMNRLQAAVVNEAMDLVTKGVAEPADIDAVMRYSLGLRWAFLGPFQTMDLNAPGGFEEYATKFGASYAALGKTFSRSEPWPGETIARIDAYLRAETPRSAIGAAQLLRDDRIAALIDLLGDAGTPVE